MVLQNTSKNIKVLGLKTSHYYGIIIITNYSSITILLFVKLQINVVTASLVNSKHDSCKENVSDTKQRSSIKLYFM